jgi:hypothetical protein
MVAFKTERVRKKEIRLNHLKLNKNIKEKYIKKAL